MKNLALTTLFCSLYLAALAQQPAKPPLDHSVYDSWQSIGDKAISNNGQWVVYTVTPQEGDPTLVIYSVNKGDRLEVPRGSNPVITEDSRYALFTIKPPYSETRQARIKKKKAAEMPRDSLGIVELGYVHIWKTAGVRSFRTPAKGSGVVAYLLEQPKKDSADNAGRKAAGATAFTDGRQAHFNSYTNAYRYGKTARLQEQPAGQQNTKGDECLTPPSPYGRLNATANTDADNDAPATPAGTESGTLVIRYLDKNLQDTIYHVRDYLFSKPGNRLLLNIVPGKKDSLAPHALLLWDVVARRADTLSRGPAHRKQLAFDEKGQQAAWFSARDTSRSPAAGYQLYYYKPGQDSGTIAVSRSSNGIPPQWDISDNSLVWFSKNGQRLFFGTAPAQTPKDTSIMDDDVARVDIWHYQDEYLQPMQLKNADKELKRSYQAVYFPATKRLVQLADRELENLLVANEGNSDYALGYTDKGQRVPLQWLGRTFKTAWLVNVNNGARKKIKDNLDGDYYLSPSGQYVAWYDMQQRHWFSYETATGITRNISATIPTAMYDEENDHPDAPEPYGMGGWLANEQNDLGIYLYDRYDIWLASPNGGNATPLTAGTGRREKLRFRILRQDEEARYYRRKQQLLLSAFNETSKQNGFYGAWSTREKQQAVAVMKKVMGPYTYSTPVKAKHNERCIFTRGNYHESPDLFVSGAGLSLKGTPMERALRISRLNPQQQQYNWGSAELFKWTAYNGKPAEGILYKPEDFDSTRKYPVLLYFYEKLSDGLYNYLPPAPTPSRLNIPFFVSRGYLVLAPDITYETGHPGKSAYEYIVSGARALAQHSWADSLHMGIQGQSWGGYQVAYLVTQTNLFAAAWAGAPVANMTSAYGGIRWESGMNRQFQYEHTQSRIGATLWEKPELYIENSPLFHLPNVQTPLAIMSNDADGAVPWYQGIELFTGLRRLGKPAWLLNYNNEAHNLMQRRNRKDIQRREQQFFDHFLKGAPAPQWIKTGVPATEKGKNWGWETATP